MASNSTPTAATATMASTKLKLDSFPGFTRITKQIFLQDPTIVSATTGPQPRVIIIYGWGDGIPRHVSKYTNGFRQLYPTARIIVVISPIFKVLTETLATRAQDMSPIVDLAYPTDTKYTVDTLEHAVIIHAMSNTGAINHTAVMHAFAERYGRAMPCTLYNHDSMPGSVKLTWENMPRWSRAMALGTARFFPWPFFVTQGIWGVFLACNEFGHWLLGADTPQVHAGKVSVDPKYADKKGFKLYLYSKEDEIIYWKDIEAAMVSSREHGYRVEGKIFDGSVHVGHMQKYPEEYWATIKAAWERAVKEIE